jgi:hypothetical protein
MRPLHDCIAMLRCPLALRISEAAIMRMMNARVVRTIATGGNVIELLRLDPVD